MNEYSVTYKNKKSGEVYEVVIQAANLEDAFYRVQDDDTEITDIALLKRGVVPFDLSSGTSEA